MISNSLERLTFFKCVENVNSICLHICISLFESVKSHQQNTTLWHEPIKDKSLNANKGDDFDVKLFYVDIKRRWEEQLRNFAPK